MVRRNRQKLAQQGIAVRAVNPALYTLPHPHRPLSR
jgi:hypothetical protein